MRIPVAIDPLALILRSDIYVKLHLPDPPPEAEIAREVQEAVGRMKAAEKKLALGRAKVLAAYSMAVQKALAKQ